MAILAFHFTQFRLYNADEPRPSGPVIFFSGATQATELVESRRKWTEPQARSSIW